MFLRLLAFVMTLMAGLKLGFLFKNNAFAATDGGTGVVSNGQIGVEVDILEEVQVNSLIDLSFDSGDGSGQYTPGSGDASATGTFCVYYNNASGVSLTLSSDNGTGVFRMVHSGINFVNYQVDIDEGNDGSFTSHGEGMAIVYPNMADNQPNCAGGRLNAMRVTVPDTGVLGVPNGTYTDTITYVIAPNP